MLPADISDVNFPYVRQAFRIERHTERRGKPTSETVYGITSLPKELASPERLLNLSRQHWAIESNHYVRDETFAEDRSQIRKKSGPQVMATLRNISIGILRLAGETSIAAGLRAFGWGKRRQTLRALGVN